MERILYPSIGIMSGSSLDGLDIALVNFYFEDKNYHSFELVYGQTYPFQASLFEKLKNIRTLSTLEYLKTDIELGKFMAECVQDSLSFFPSFKPVLIGNHGNTAFHQPKNGFSTQIGCNFTIAQTTKITTVGNFRSKLVAQGHQGAPLAPLADNHLFSQYLACINIGGIANISFNKTYQGFDICPANQLLNYLSNKLNLAYDENGSIASTGRIDVELLNILQELNKTFNKQSISNEEIAKLFFPILEHKNIADALATSVEFMAKNIAEAILNNGEKNGKILISGGGAFNDFLINKIKQNAPTYHFEIASKAIVESKEAIIFAFLGLATLQNIPLQLSENKQDTIKNIGLIYLP